MTKLCPFWGELTAVRHIQTGLPEQNRQDQDNEIFSEPLHADASQRAQLNGQMMGGSREEQPHQIQPFVLLYNPFVTLRPICPH